MPPRPRSASSPASATGRRPLVCDECRKKKVKVRNLCTSFSTHLNIFQCEQPFTSGRCKTCEMKNRNCSGPKQTKDKQEKLMKNLKKAAQKMVQTEGAMKMLVPEMVGEAGKHA